MSDERICSNGRTPEEEVRYGMDNDIPLRDTQPTADEFRQWSEEILERDSELLQMLADGHWRRG